MNKAALGLLVCFCMTSLMASAEPQEGSLFPAHLRCEYKENPLGIDILHPRLSWEAEAITATERGLKQNSYQIVIASSLALLEQNIGDFWDTGKVQSSQTTHILYNGKTPASNQDFYWKVRIWDQDDARSAWSRPARWSTGLLSPGDWQAQWIEQPFRTDFDQCQWIWFPEGNPTQQAPAGTVYFRKTFTLDSPASEARILLTGDDYFTLYLDGQKILQSPQHEDAWDSPQIVDLGSLGSGKHCLAIAVTNKTESPAGLTAKLMLLENQTQMTLLPDASWKLSKEEAPDWTALTFDDQNWQSAKVLGYVGAQNTPWGVPGDEDDLILSPPPYFVKTMQIDKPVQRAMVYATAHGMFELNLNGQKVGNDFFRPGWSDYRYRLYYNTYDITTQLQSGKNDITAILADGWYTGYIGWGKRRNHYAGPNKIRVQVMIDYEDGSKEIIGTDASWSVLKQTPILEGDFLHGEVHDARLEAAMSVDGPAALSADQDTPGIQLDAYPGENVIAVTEFPAKKISEPQPGVFVYDLGQNMVGFARLTVQGPAGTAVRLRFAERLNEDGTLYTTNLRTARATDTYILKGEGTEVWEPRFTFHGFRYVEVTGYPGHPGLDAVTGVVLHTEMAEAGSFVCSNAMVNQLIHNIDWGMRGNYLELPTDCPQRDERMGWTGDAQVFMRTGTFNKDIAAFFTKWLQDLVDSQRADGSYTDVAPDVAGLGSGTAAWADAGIVCPYTMYKVYGDIQILQKNYESMQRYIEYLKTHSEELIRPNSGYGDWLSLNADTPRDLLGTAYFAYVSRLMSEIADVLGMEADAQDYKKLYEDIRAAFIKKYLRNGTLEGNTQTAYALALNQGLIPEDQTSRAVYNLVRDLQVRDYHFSTGFVGLPQLLPVLTQINRLDLAYRLLLNDTFPSWGFEIQNGATTIWERWDGWTPEFGFQDPGMNSFNHYAYGAVGEWMYTTIAGIDTEGAGYQSILINPRPGGDFAFVKAKYHAITGWIGSEWYDSAEKYTMKVRIPPNTTAKVYVKARDAESVTESGKAIPGMKHVAYVGYEEGHAIYQVNSGYYVFESKK